MSIDAALRSIAERWPGLRSPSDEAPVFVLASGWRSGSTLVQRMMMRRCLVWGEPFGRALPVDLMARQLRVITDGWPPDANFIDRRVGRLEDLGREWVANLTPPIEALLRAHVAYFDELLRAPAQRLGVSRWGLKEVRLAVEHARYLRWLFPRARFVFLIRDPYAAYRSFKGLTEAYRSWPDEPVDTPERFGRHWRTLTEGFLAGAEAIDARLVRYESVCATDFDPRPLEDYLGFALDMEARAVRIGAFAGPPATEDELRRCGQEVEPLAAELGYRRSRG